MYFYIDISVSLFEGEQLTVTHVSFGINKVLIFKSIYLYVMLWQKVVTLLANIVHTSVNSDQQSKHCKIKQSCSYEHDNQRECER